MNKKGMMSNKRYTLFIIILFTLILFAGISSVIVMKNRHAKEVVQMNLQAEVKRQEEKKQEEQRKLEEQKKLEDEKKQEELKKLEEQKKQEEKIKHQQAIKGIGTSKRIPILMYHSIAYQEGNELRIPKEKFREQMKYLYDNGYTPLSMDELYSHMVFGTKVPEKPIVITLDDGYVDNYTNAYPVLKEFGFKATVFMITGAATDTAYLNWEQIKEMDSNGVSIEAHTVTHPKLNELSKDKQLIEIRDSKLALEKYLQREIKYFAYPYGEFNDDTLYLMQELGYKMSLSTMGGQACKSDGIYKLHRIYVSNNHSMDRFKDSVRISN